MCVQDGHYYTELCATYHGFSLHADTVVQAEDRDRLKQLCRYIQRPVIAQDRLQELSDGRYYYGFKRIWKNGTKDIFLSFSPSVFLYSLSHLATINPLITPMFNFRQPLRFLLPCLWCVQRPFPYILTFEKIVTGYLFKTSSHKFVTWYPKRN